MRISSKVEEPTRELFGHAIRGEFEDFARKLAEFNNEALGESLRLTAAIAAIVALDDNDGEPLSDDDHRELAESVSEMETRIEVTPDEVYAYLSKVVFGGQQLTEVFSTEDAVRLPFVIAGTLVAANTRTEDGQKWPEYLDQVEAAIEAAPDHP